MGYQVYEQTVDGVTRWAGYGVHDPAKEDSWIDSEGYMRLGRMLATELEGDE